MRKIIGNKISVYLKTSTDDVSDLIGLLVDVSEEDLYLRDVEEIDKLYIIPRNNVKYCSTIDKIPREERAINVEREGKVSQQNAYTEQQNQTRYLEVFVNNVLITQIPVHPTFQIDAWHEGIMRIVLASPDVKSALVGKIQESVNYVPGKVYITCGSGEEHHQHIQEPFVMGGGGASNSFLNPSQMISRLNQAVKRGKNNAEEDEDKKE